MKNSSLKPVSENSSMQTSGQTSETAGKRRRLKATAYFKKEEYVSTLVKLNPPQKKRPSKKSKAEKGSINAEDQNPNGNTLVDKRGNAKKQKRVKVIDHRPEQIRRSPEDNFFFGFREGIDLSARMETGMFGKSIVVDGIRLSQYDGPSCIQLDKRWSSTQCDSCEFFSPNNCLLRWDEFLLEDINRFTEIRAERAEAFARKRRIITKTIYKELKAHGRPLHYTVIARIIMERYPKFKLKDHSVYHYLLWHPELFERVDAGVYRAK